MNVNYPAGNAGDPAGQSSPPISGAGAGRGSHRKTIQVEWMYDAHGKLDKSNLTNWGNLDEGLMAKLHDVDPGNEYSFPYLWGTTGIGYDAVKIAAIMPDAPIGFDDSTPPDGLNGMRPPIAVSPASVSPPR